MIELGQELCSSLESATMREWLETNGLGGYASSTVSCLNARRYHGLLVAALNPPVGRCVLLAKLEEALVIDGRRFELSVNQYPGGVVHPQGCLYLRRFRLDPFPVFTYEVEGIELEKSVFMIHGENSTVVQYALRRMTNGASNLNPLLAEGRCQLEVRPLVAFRDYHSLTHENALLNSHVQAEARSASVKPYPDLPALHFAHNAAVLEASGVWYRNFEYNTERERGLDFTEDLFSPFVLKATLDSDTQFSIIASTERHDINRANDFKQAELKRRRAIVAVTPVDDETVRALVAATDQFIVKRGEHKTIIAGYHWFGDWGRDTMIALTGLTLVTKRTDVARSILVEFSRHIRHGMLPNRFPDAGEQPEYNTVDATLWFFEAVRALLAYTNDYEFVRTNFYDKLADIIAWHVHGTEYGIRVDADGLITAGEEGTQLTWMDAKVGDYVVTPRRGKPVEVQALWYNALRVMEHLAHEFDDATGEHQYNEMAVKASRSFNASFWNEEVGCLFDVIDATNCDASIRPNQIFAVSLPHSMLCRNKAQRVVETVERHLLTPYGLRSLSPHDPKYHPRYEGGVYERDSAYHQGTVWAWLMGPFITAYIKVNNRNQESLQQAKEWMQVIHLHLRDACLGQVSEIFDGDTPLHPRGCAAQAWSVAELLRASVEDIADARRGERQAANHAAVPPERFSGTRRDLL